MDCQTPRDWVHRFNDEGPEGLVNRPAPGNERRLTRAQEAELARWMEAGQASVGLDHLTRWRCLDLEALILERWCVDSHKRTIGKLLERMGFSHITTRPRHYRQDEAAREAVKKLPAMDRGDPQLTCPWHDYDAVCDAWNRLIAERSRIAPIGSRPWAIGQS